MKPNKKIFAAVMTAVMAAASVPQCQPVITANAATSSVAKKAYSLSKKAGTYSKTIRLKLTAKNGYRIYYAKNGKLTEKKVLKSGKSKIFTISKTTTLTLYKSKTAKTAKQLQSSQVKKASIKYVYKINGNHTDDSAVQTTNPSQDNGAAQTTNPSQDNDAAQTTNPSQGNDAAQPTDPGTRPGQVSSDDTGDPESAQNTASDIAETASAKEAAIASAKPAAVKPAETTASTPVITCTNANAEVSSLQDDSAVDIRSANGICAITIKQAGTYILTGGSQNAPAKNITVSVDCDAKDSVHLVFNNLHIDNSSMGTSASQDVPVICMEKGTKQTDITLIGASALTGNGSFASKPASAVIHAKDSGAVLTLLAADESASLSVTDGTDASTNFGANDPSDGISSKGTLILQSGTYHISSNGDCLKGTGANGNGGIVLSDGTYRLESMLGCGMKSKNGSIYIYDGTINMARTGGDGIQSKNYAVNIAGGSIVIDQCYGDGIQGEDICIMGDNTELDITTVFENAGKNYYNSALGSGNYNTMEKTDSKKTEVVQIDTGSHKGIKAGTKSCTYSYRETTADSGLEAGKIYTKEASGSILITGGQIKVNTAQTGIKYNGGMGMGQTSSGNITPANNDGQYIIGAPEDAVHSNNAFYMIGGKLEITSADDGISAGSDLIILNESIIDITDSYEGMEGGTIIIGSTGNTSPQVTICSNDDGVNAASKSSIHYDYADESEESYTKTQISAENNTFYMLDGYVNVMIADDKTHSYSLPMEDGSITEGSFTADGDGIDCNGSFYAYGGTVIVYGSTSNGNSPIDTDKAYYIGSGVTILAAGSGGMAENPTGKAQAAIICGGMTQPGGNNGSIPAPPDGNNGSIPAPPDGNNGNSNIPAQPDGNNGSNIPAQPDGSNNGMPTPPDGNNGSIPTSPDGQSPNPGMFPDGSNGNNANPNEQTGSLSVSAGTAIAVLDSNGDTVMAFKAPKALGYLLYSSPMLTAGSAYTISSGGTVDGTPVYETGKYDFRYTNYLLDNASTQIEVTAEN